MKAKSATVFGLYAAGFLLAFVGERLVGSGGGRQALTSLGVAAALAALAWRGGRVTQAAPERQPIERAFLVLQGLGGVGLALYFAQSDLWKGLQTSPRLTAVFAVLWPILVAVSILPALLGELAYAAMSRAAVVEAARVKDAVLSGWGLAGALVFASSLLYTATAWDPKWDLSYFRTSRPGGATRAIAASLDEPLEVDAFFPPANEVRDEVMEYLTDLARGNPKFQVKAYDQALDVARAKELGVKGNGTVALKRKAHTEQLSVGLDLEAARGQLARLDQDFQKKLIAAVKERRTVYWVSGHGERTEASPVPPDPRAGARIFKEVLQSQNYDVKTLTAADGLGVDVPKDAAMVVILGPQSAFAPEESASLRRYLDGGGRTFIALDPENGQDLDGVLSRLGLTFHMTPLASDHDYFRRTNQLSDRRLLVTASYSSHPAVTTLTRLGRNGPTGFFGSGYLDERKDKPADVTIDFTVRSAATTFNDLNDDNQFDPPQEKRQVWNLAAAVTGKRPGAKPEDQLRAVVLADSDGVSDAVIENPGNTYLALDGVKWLMGDDAIAGEISSEEDKPVEHTRRKDVAFFYGTVFLVPALVVAAGWGVTRRRGRRGGGR